MKMTKEQKRYHELGMKLKVIFSIIKNLLDQSNLSETELIEYELFVNKRDVMMEQHHGEIWKSKNGPKVSQMLRKRIQLLKSIMDEVKKPIFLKEEKNVENRVPRRLSKSMPRKRSI